MARLLAFLVLIIAPIARADEPPEPLAKGIQDNSFLIEEAYNQEVNVIQHILNVRWSLDRSGGTDTRAWDILFTQEWPVFSQAHQFSYAVPYSFLSGGGSSAQGPGDVFLNYRFQALEETQTRPAFAPRFSLILPTGDEKKGLGNGTVGYQFGLPFSKIVHNRWTLHGNAGLTFFPDDQGKTPVGYNLGASAVFAAARRLNFLAEFIAEWHEDVNFGRIERSFEATLMPGVRYAFDFPTAQMVIGLGVPIGLNEAAPDYGAFFYFSFEHQLRKKTGL